MYIIVENIEKPTIVTNKNGEVLKFNLRREAIQYGEENLKEPIIINISKKWSYIIVKYDNETHEWIFHKHENEFTGETKIAFYKTEEEATKEAEKLRTEYEIYKFIKDSL